MNMFTSLPQWKQCRRIVRNFINSATEFGGQIWRCRITGSHGTVSLHISQHSGYSVKINKTTRKMLQNSMTMTALVTVTYWNIFSLMIDRVGLRYNSKVALQQPPQCNLHNDITRVEKKPRLFKILCQRQIAQCLDNLIHSGDIHNQSLKVVRDCIEFWTFWPQTFRGRGPKFWDLDYKTTPSFDHVAKFHSNQPRELRDFVIKKEKRYQA